MAGHGLGDLNPALFAIDQRGVSARHRADLQGSNTYTFCTAADVQSDGSCASSLDLVTVPGFSGNGCYNDATGWGTVDAASFVPALALLAR